jgi:dolichol-phosphate mannosyltransferase
MKIDISLVTPVFNEENNIGPFIISVKETLNKISSQYEIIFVLDPSTDNTEALIKNFSKTDPRIKLITLSRRFGQPAATIAGIHHANGNNVVVIDVDLQDPPEIIIKMHNKMKEGYDVVYGKRINRDGETFLKKVVSNIGYRLINYMSDLNIPRDVGDFRMMSSRVVENLKNLNENHGFLRGLVSYVGFKQTFVEFDRKARNFDKSKYNKFFGSIRIGLNGLICFTSKPLQIMSVLGFFFSTISFLIGFVYLITKVMGFNLSPGLPTTILFITFFSGLQLISLGLLGEYVSRIYDEVKKRPQYIIDEKINF